MKDIRHHRKNFIHALQFFFLFFILIINSIQKVLLETLPLHDEARQERLHLTRKPTVPSKAVKLRKEHKFLCTPCGKEFLDGPTDFHKDKRVNNTSFDQSVMVDIENFRLRYLNLPYTFNVTVYGAFK